MPRVLRLFVIALAFGAILLSPLNAHAASKLDVEQMLSHSMLVPPTPQTTPQPFGSDGVAPSCPLDVQMSVTGGTLYGWGCLSWSNVSLYWAIDSVTQGPSSYELESIGSGYDQCHGANYVWQMNVGPAYTYNTTYDDGGWGVGQFQNCGTGHNYEVTDGHYRKQYSSSSWVGANGASYH